VQREELLTKCEVFHDEVLAGTQGADYPSDEMPERRGHGRNLIGTPRNKTAPKSFNLRVHDVLMRHSEDPLEINPAGVIAGFFVDASNVYHGFLRMP